MTPSNQNTSSGKLQKSSSSYPHVLIYASTPNVYNFWMGCRITLIFLLAQNTVMSRAQKNVQPHRTQTHIFIKIWNFASNNWSQKTWKMRSMFFGMVKWLQWARFSKLSKSTRLIPPRPPNASDDHETFTKTFLRSRGCLYIPGMACKNVFRLRSGALK